MHCPKFIKKYPANVDGRDFVVGDLHGCYDELVKLLKYVQFNPKFDRLFSTGDLIDRGPKPMECLDLLNKDWFHPVLGNHEDLYLEKIDKINQGMMEGFDYHELEFIDAIKRYMPQIMKLPLVMEIDHLLYGKVYIVHAEILPEHLFANNMQYSSKEYVSYLNFMEKNDLSKQLTEFFSTFPQENYDYILKQKMIWSRKVVTFFYEKNKQSINSSDFSFMNKHKFNQGIKVFCGHNVIPFPMKIGQQYYIDTGAALGYHDKIRGFDIFTQFGHEFFGLTLVDIATGVAYNCITNESKRGTIVKLQKNLYEDAEI